MLTFGKGATVFFDLAIAIKVSCLVCSLASEVSSFSREAEPLPLLFFLTPQCFGVSISYLIIIKVRPTLPRVHSYLSLADLRSNLARTDSHSHSTHDHLHDHRSFLPRSRLPQIWTSLAAHLHDRQRPSLLFQAT